MKKLQYCVMGLILLVSPLTFAQQTVTLTYNSGPFAIDLDTDAKIAVIANRLSNNATVVKLTDNTLKTVTLDKDANGNSFKDSTGAVLTALAPTSVALFAGGTRAIVTNFASNTVSIIDTNIDKPVTLAMVPVGNGPRAVAVATKENLALVANLNGNSVSFIDLNTNANAIPAPIPVGTSPISIAYDPDNSRAYVVNYAPPSGSSFNNISVLDVPTRINIGSVSLAYGSNPVDIAISTQHKLALVADSVANLVNIVDLTSGTNTSSVNIGVGSHPFAVAVNPKTDQAVVLSNGSKTINLINLSDSTISDDSKSKTVIENISNNPVDLAVDPAANIAYVVEYSSSVMLLVNLGYTSYLPYALDTDKYRSNLVVNNLSKKEANVSIALIDQNGSTLASGSTKVPASGLNQINNINRYLKGTANVTNTTGYLKLNSDQPFACFISLNDNASNDPSLQVGRHLGYTHFLLNAATNVGSFQSGLFLTNLSNMAASVTLTAYANDTGSVLATKTGISLPINGFYMSDDVLGDMGISGKFGSLDIQSVTLGPILAHSLVKSTSNTNGFLEAIPIQ
jgi:YVTN family beta-propeller protein